MLDFQKKILDSHAGRHWSKIGVHHHHGFVAPLFSLHSESSCGIGEYPDLEMLFPWCREVGFDVIQLLPVNDSGIDISPYSAITANALNPLHLGLSHLPYIQDDQELQTQITLLQQLNRCQRVDYPLVQKGKESFLREYFQHHGKAITASAPYIAFKEQNKAWLQAFILFKALKVKNSWISWERWPEEFKNPSAQLLEQGCEDLLAEMEYHGLVQYLCWEQFKQIKEKATRHGVFIKGDIPILINRESADVWQHREHFLLDYAAGAPPDRYAAEGQKWGFPLYNWEELAAHDYSWWIERLRVASQYFHLYRIDHIVGFFRIWGIPLDKEAKDGHFIPEDKSSWIHHGKTIMKMMLKHCDLLPIGEDLGTIPPEVRVCLRHLGICSTKVMRWERNWDSDQSFIDPKAYYPESMTTVSTHDSETLDMWWKDQASESVQYAVSLGWKYRPILTPHERIAILTASHHSGSLFHINLLQEYLAIIPHLLWSNPSDERINVPGVIADTNWSYRFRPSIEEIVTNVTLKRAIKSILA